MHSQHCRKRKLNQMLVFLAIICFFASWQSVVHTNTPRVLHAERPGNGSFRVVWTWNTCGVFAGWLLWREFMSRSSSLHDYYNKVFTCCLIDFHWKICKHVWLRRKLELCACWSQDRTIASWFVMVVIMV